MMKRIGNFLLITKDDANYTISMTAELQDDVGTVGFVEFNKDETLAVDDVILNLEASKTVLEIATPVAGTVVERNLAAEDNPQLLNSANADENWLVKLTNIDEAAFNALEEA